MHPFDVGPWRAPSVNTNTFARESHIDVLAAKAGVDPLEFRLKHLSDKRMVGVLQTAAEKFGWKPGKAPSGRGVGMSCGVYSGTYIATCAEVAVNKTTGRVQVKRMVLAQDQGVTVNPEGIAPADGRQHHHGAGLRAHRRGALQGRRGAAPQLRQLRAAAFFLAAEDRDGADRQPGHCRAQGCGEPPIINIGAVIANAIYDAVGARVLQLPMTPERVLAALKKG